MNVVHKLAIALSLGLSSVLAASAASPETAYLRSFSKGPGVPEPVKVVAPEIVNAPAGAVAMISFVVDSTGLPQDIQVTQSSHDRLAAAAVDAVKQWRFAPVMRDGVAVETKVLLPVRVIDSSLLSGNRFAAK